MEYLSTRNDKISLKFEHIFIKGLSEDGGLFLPKKIEKFSEKEFSNLKALSYVDLATEIIYKFIGDFCSKEKLHEIVKKSYSSFSEKEVVKIRKVEDLQILELFHGPTLAFKDVAMQLIGNFYEYYLSKTSEKINIVVATSGDTGAAAIDAVKGKKNINIFVLHPNNRISPVQRMLMTTNPSKNVFNIAVEGNFDDCQKLVKQMFSDHEFSKSINMSGVNSINWARIVAQSVYYFFCYFKLDKKEKVSFSVPTGNFGDVYAGYLAKKMGLPIDKLLVATNENDILHRAISKGDYKANKVQETISPSMDIQVASNFERLLFDIYNEDSNKVVEIMNNIKSNKFNLDQSSLKKIQKDFISGSLNEKEILETIKHIYKNNRIVIDPHTAIGVGAVKKHNEKNYIVLATAHPCKFPNAILKAIDKKEELPNHLKGILNQREEYEVFQNNIENLKSYIKKIVNEIKD